MEARRWARRLGRGEDEDAIEAERVVECEMQVVEVTRYFRVPRLFA